ncbi:MAG: hypothetical protein LQ346_006438 [Caloplaca aetnensis]|nr:MAG: hypothetical protein LQ346_006438 [Caloplaca aetnensis]
MVKADPKCDYYADLELPPSADAVEIKKQFKKLALKYHPDRNPGKELEFNSKFQAIQSAHEVLTDPQQRAKYDADRIRSGLLHTYTSPVRPQPPPRAAASNFPPPPRRTPQASTTANIPHPPATGANRYTNHMKPDPATAPKSYAEESRARANAFKAWEQMRHGQAVPPQARPVPPRPAKTAAFQPGREAGSFPPKDPTQRPPRDQTKEPVSGFPTMARSNTTRAPKKGGFAPGFSTNDEPQARNSSAYSSMSKGERPDISRSNPDSHTAHPPPPPTAKHPDPRKPLRPHSATDNPFASSERISTPYATTGGEKTYFTSTGLPRSVTSRDGLRSGDIHDSEPTEGNGSHIRPASTTTQRGHGSASPKLKSPRAVSISSVSSSSSDESLREGVEQLYTSAAKTHDAHGRSQNGHLKPAYKPFVRADNVDAGDRAHPAGPNPAFTRRVQTPASDVDPGLAEGFMKHRMKHEAERTQGLRESVHSAPRPKEAGLSQQRPLHRPKSWHDKYEPTRQMHAQDSIGRPATGEFPAKPSMYDYPAFDPSLFFPSSRKCFLLPTGTNEQPVHPPPLRSHSSDTISVNFSPSDWHGKFTGNSPEYFESPPRQNNIGRGRTSPTKRTTSPLKTAHPAQSEGQAPMPNGDPHGPRPPPEPSAQESYSPDKWAPYFKPGTLRWPPPPPPPGGSTGGTARAVSRKRPKTPSRRESRSVFKRPAISKPANVAPAVDDAADEASSSNAESLSSSRSSGAGSAMDLDTNATPPSAGKPAGSGSHRASDLTVTDSVAPPRPVPSAVTGPGQGQSRDRDQLNLSHFKNVAPFAPNQEGIKDLNDLTTTLPFQSRPSARPPSSPVPQPLQLPSPPKAPVAPEQLAPPAWERYTSAMRAYMNEWNAYNTKMLNHFNERLATVKAMSLKPDWMTAVGDGGYEKYMRGVEDDFRVREHWDVSWERHRECMKTLGTVREKLLGVST